MPIPEQETTSSSELVSNLAVATLAAFLGALFAFTFTLWIARRQRVASTTASMIDEYSSRPMLQSRFATSDIAEQVRDGSISLRDVALTTVQGCPVGFVGRTIDGLTEHQHMSIFIGWIRRLAVQIQYRWISRRIVSATLGGSLQWTLPFLLELADEAEKVVDEYPSDVPRSQRAAWIYAVRRVHGTLASAGHRRRIPGGSGVGFLRRRVHGHANSGSEEE